MKKRLISILLALAMLFAVLPQMALLASAKDASGSCGANLTWSFDEATGTLTITGSGAMTDYDWSGNPDWLEFRSQIKSLSLPAGLTSIGTAAFIRFRKGLGRRSPHFIAYAAFLSMMTACSVVGGMGFSVYVPTGIC